MLNPVHSAMVKFLLIFCLSLSFISMKSYAQIQNQTSDITVERDIIYKTVDSLQLKLNLFIPQQTDTARKLLVILPDETMSRRSDYELLATVFAENGLISLVLDYRQPPGYSHPIPVEDVLDAIEWIKSNSESYGIKVLSVGLTGQNFGGYLASLIALKHSEKIRLVAAIHSPMDLTSYRPPWGYPYRYHVLAGGPEAAIPEKWKELSPIYQVKKSSPYFLLIHGKNDTRVPVSQSIEMRQTLTNNMAQAMLHEIENANNGYFLADSNQAETGRLISEFAAEMVEIPDNISVEKDVVYTEIDGRKLHLDVYKPVNTTETLPAVLFFHGGGWMWGRKENMERYAAELASHGFVTFTVEYRLAREALYPACIDDARAALKWVKSVAQKYNLDPTKIGLAGQSAGGHIAAMLGVTNSPKIIDYMTGPENYSTEVQSIATLSGVVDMLALYSRDAFSPAALFGVSPMENKEVYIESSPLYNVSESSSRFLFIHGSEDHLGLLSEMLEMTKKLKNRGIQAETFTIEGGDHAFEQKEEYRSLAFQKLLQFMNETLKE